MELPALITLCTTVGTVAGAFYAGWNRVGTKKVPLNELLARLEGKVDTVVDSVNGLHGKVAKVEVALEKLPPLEQRLEEAEDRVSYLENGGFR
jgi:predicted nuclease with TOPRIM domain